MENTQKLKSIIDNLKEDESFFAVLSTRKEIKSRIHGDRDRIIADMVRLTEKSEKFKEMICSVFKSIENK